MEGEAAQRGAVFLCQQAKRQEGTAVVFCKSRNFLVETPESLQNHVSFLDSVFGVKLQQEKDLLNMVWFVAKENSEFLYMAGHTDDAVVVINALHDLCVRGIGTQITDIYLNTCTSKPDNEAISRIRLDTTSIVFISDANEEEKKKLGLDKSKFVTLGEVFEKVKDDGFRIHLCLQDTVTDLNVKMAFFLPMDKCGLGFSPTKSELLLYNHKGTLAEKLSAAFETAVG
jgi:hypothetical protein